MAASVALEHRTTYRFERPAVLGPHLVRLRPAPHSRTPIESYSLSVEPAGLFLNWQQDPFGNHVARLVFPEPVRELDITVNLVQPGSTNTDMNPADSEFGDFQRSLIPLGRFGDPRDVAAAVAFLASSAARQISGSIVTVDGGLNA